MSDAGEGAPPKKKGRKFLFLLVLPLLLALVSGGAAYMMGLLALPGGTTTEAAASEGGGATEIDPEDIVFVAVPDMLVNLNLAGNRLRFLKFAASLEVVGEDQAERVTQLVPRVTDNIHAYLRAIEVEELSGPDAVYRVKRDLLSRVNQVVRPLQVRDVLIKEMLVQ